MKVHDFQPLTKSDIPELPIWAERLIEPVHIQLQRITILLQKKIGIRFNFNGELRDIKVRSGQPVTIKVQNVDGPPVKVKLVYTDPSFYHHLQWSLVNSDTISVLVALSSEPSFSGAVGTVPTEEVTIRLEIEGE